VKLSGNFRKNRNKFPDCTLSEISQSINQSVINLYSTEAQKVFTALERRVILSEQTSLKVAFKDIGRESRISKVFCHRFETHW